MAIAIIAVAEFGIRELAQLTPRHQMGAHMAPILTDARAQHILYGDSHGGGHLHGAGRPCKSEFPPDWNKDHILSAILRNAANDNLEWHHEANGYEVADATDGGVTIRLVVNGAHSEIITAYPLNTPRNSCPAANDNRD